MFWIAYFFHSKFSFKDFKKVGVAIYANGVEDIPQIFNEIANFPDFIHVDIVDQTVNKNSKKVLSYKTEVIKAKEFVKAGGKIEAIKKKYQVTPDLEKELKTL